MAHSCLFSSIIKLFCCVVAMFILTNKPVSWKLQTTNGKSNYHGIKATTSPRGIAVAHSCLFSSINKLFSCVVAIFILMNLRNNLFLKNHQTLGSKCQRTISVQSETQMFWVFFVSVEKLSNSLCSQMVFTNVRFSLVLIVIIATFQSVMAFV
jgi:hypothetical protein